MFFHMVYKSAQIFLPFCHNPRMWRTDRRTKFSSLHRVCITCSEVIKLKRYWRNLVQRFLNNVSTLIRESWNDRCARAIYHCYQLLSKEAAEFIWLQLPSPNAL